MKVGICGVVCKLLSAWRRRPWQTRLALRSEEHTSELQSRRDLVCRLLLEKKKQLDAAAERHPVRVEDDVVEDRVAPSDVEHNGHSLFVGAVAAAFRGHGESGGRCRVIVV